MTRIIGIDPGEDCGIVVLDGGQITSVFNIISENVASKITPFLIHPNCKVVIEDIRPFSLRLTPQVISVCKFIGQLEWRLRIEANAFVELCTRNHVKKWVFDTFPEICTPEIVKKIAKKGYKSREDGTPRRPSFVFVDDRIVTKAMKELYKIPDVKPGYGYNFGLKSHSFQALALASYWYLTKIMKS